MSTGSVLSSLLWFAAIVGLIPAALWLLKRTPAGGAGAQGLMRTVAVLPLSPNQRIVTVEIGHGDARRWLVLGVSAQQISTLHEMAPQDGQPTAAPPPAAPFAQVLARLTGKDGRDAR
jgi:flagellar protein FliO/FliZ